MQKRYHAKPHKCPRFPLIAAFKFARHTKVLSLNLFSLYSRDQAQSFAVLKSPRRERSVFEFSSIDSILLVNIFTDLLLSICNLE